MAGLAGDGSLLRMIETDALEHLTQFCIVTFHRHRSARARLWRRGRKSEKTSICGVYAAGLSVRLRTDVVDHFEQCLQLELLKSVLFIDGQHVHRVANVFADAARDSLLDEPVVRHQADELPALVARL